MSTVDWERNVGDTGPALSKTLRELPAGAQRVGDPIDLSGATVTATVTREVDDAVIDTPTATIVDTAGGQVTIPCAAIYTAEPGLYAILWTITGTTTRTLPIGGADYLLVTGVSTGTPGVIPVAPAAAEIRSYNGTDYVADPDAVIYVVGSGHPFPATQPGDIIIEKP